MFFYCLFLTCAVSVAIFGLADAAIGALMYYLEGGENENQDT